jgi:hypothetical protein
MVRGTRAKEHDESPITTLKEATAVFGKTLGGAQGAALGMRCPRTTHTDDVAEMAEREHKEREREREQRENRERAERDQINKEKEREREREREQRKN